MTNFPTVGLFDGRFRKELEASDLGFAREVEMIATAHELGLFTIVYVFTPQEAAAMAAAGADAIIAHMGLTVGGSIGMSAEDAITLDELLLARAGDRGGGGRAAGRRDGLCHGGPIATPEDATT